MKNIFNSKRLVVRAYPSASTTSSPPSIVASSLSETFIVKRACTTSKTRVASQYPIKAFAHLPSCFLDLF